MDKHLSKANNAYLTHKQMTKGFDHTRDSLNTFKFKFLEANRKLSILHTAINL